MKNRVEQPTTLESVVPAYLDLLDAQREAAFAALEGLNEEEIWRRPAPKAWCIGELLDHNYLLIASALPYVRFAWRFLSWYGRRARSRPYRSAMPDLYRTGRFPMWVGFLWTPRCHPWKRVSLDKLKAELRELHSQVRSFYAGKDEGVLGHVVLYDPYFGCLNLILTLRLGIYHDQLHYEDIVGLSRALKDQ